MTQNSGWLALRRDWRAHLPLKPQELDEFSACLWAIEQAAFRPHLRWFNGLQVPLERGQLVTSFTAMTEAFGWSLKRVRGFEERMRKHGFWAPRRAPHHTVITICNFDEISPPADAEGHSEGQGEGIARAQQGHTREHVKHDKHGEHELERGSPKRSPIRLPEDFEPDPVGGQTGELLAQWSRDQLNLELEAFRDHWSSPDCKHPLKRDWQAAWRTWVRRSSQFNNSGLNRSGHGKASNERSDCIVADLLRGVDPCAGEFRTPMARAVAERRDARNALQSPAGQPPISASYRVTDG